MRVIVAQSAGFCWGVDRAVDRARQLARRGTGPVYTDGPLIHNRQMMDRLAGEGILETADPSALGKATLLIRAHGIPPDRRHALSQRPVELVDATCPDVARIQGMIRRHARQGGSILIYGDEGHAEVTGLLGFAESRGHVVGNPSDVARLPPLERVCLVSQSTQFPAAFADIAEVVRKRFPDVVVLDTICKSTRNRQLELTAMSREVDAFVVVGGRHSANTVRLAELASSLRPTFLIQTAADLDQGRLSAFRVIGITAGASTPAFVIEAVRLALEAIKPA